MVRRLGRILFRAAILLSLAVLIAVGVSRFRPIELAWGDALTGTRYEFALRPGGLVFYTSSGVRPSTEPDVFQGEVRFSRSWEGPGIRYDRGTYRRDGSTFSSFILATWWPLLACSPALAWWTIRVISRSFACRQRTRKGLCASCGYDLRATPGRCPECGAVPTPAHR